MSQLASLSAKNIGNVMSRIKEGVAIVDADGQITPVNFAFVMLPEQVKEKIQAYLLEPGNMRSHQTAINGYSLVLTQDGEQYLLMSVPPSHASPVAQLTLTNLSKAMEHAEDIYVAAAEAISNCLDWRWVAITRFVNVDRLEVLAFWDKDHSLASYEYDIAGTPCELVVQSERFTLYSDLASEFPEYQALQEMGAKTYVGLIYRNAKGTPLGHVMALNDSRDVDFVLAEEVINVATLALSSHFQLLKTKDKLKVAEKEAITDGLTGVGNRKAFDDELELVRNNHEVDWAIAIIDLDNLKQLNDSLGHAEGDKFIQLMANELRKIGRRSDPVFRLGGDEFAIIFEHASPLFISSLIKRFNEAVFRVRLTVNFPVDASIGIAALSETQGDINAWVQMADQRMYDDKIAKRPSSRDSA